MYIYTKTHSGREIIDIEHGVHIAITKRETDFVIMTHFRMGDPLILAERSDLVQAQHTLDTLAIKLNAYRLPDVEKPTG